MKVRVVIKQKRQKRFGTKSLEANPVKLSVVLPKGGRQFNKMETTDKSEYKPVTMGELSKKEMARMRREKSKRDNHFMGGKLKTNAPSI